MSIIYEILFTEELEAGISGYATLSAVKMWKISNSPPVSKINDIAYSLRVSVVDVNKFQWWPQAHIQILYFCRNNHKAQLG